ncbi:MAG TPA: chorismate lyase [Albitalea sp.]|nr:chorismate lyase [Albitalea sp.]
MSGARRALLRLWLRAPGSLSRRIAALGRHFAVQTLYQGPLGLTDRERGDVGNARSWVREVLLRVDGRPLVWARSVTPRRALGGPWRALRGLGTRPLADLLFNDRRVRRTPLRREHLLRGSTLQRRLARQWQAATGAPPPRGMVWARSSVFRRHGPPLRVMEVFAPALTWIKPPRVAPPRVRDTRR